MSDSASLFWLTPAALTDSIMDEDTACSSKSDTIYAATVSVVVHSAQHNGEPAIQLWPCIHVPSAPLIPQAVKDVYSKLAAVATEIDQGLPALLMTLIATGNAFNSDTHAKLEHGLRRIVGHCGLWAITSGEQEDPIASVLADVLRSSLSQIDSPCETLLIVANNSKVVYRAAQPMFQMVQMVDSRYNTLYVLLQAADTDADLDRETRLFRCRLAMKLSSPPPGQLKVAVHYCDLHLSALLIGVPDERNMFSTAQTPISSMGGAIILPSTTAIEHRPLPVSVFCGASLDSLAELLEHVVCGVPVLVVQDSSELCAVIHNSTILYESASFEHQRFVEWLRVELTMIAASMDVDADGNSSDGDTAAVLLENAERAVCTILATALGERRLVGFVTIAQLDRLPEHLLELFLSSTIDVEDYRRILELAVRLDAPSIVRRLDVPATVRRENVTAILEQMLANEKRVEVLAALLDQRVPIVLSAELLWRWLDNTYDKYFFQSIVLGSLLGYTNRPQSLTESLARDINDLLTDLSGGIRHLFSSDLLFSPAAQTAMTHDAAAAHTIPILAVWALLLNQSETARCLCAYAPEPLGLSIVLAKIARSLAYESREWFFFESRLQTLSSTLCSNAYELLNEAFVASPVKTYRAICFKSSLFNQLTLPQLAYEIIAHECCQRWALRLLYGSLQLGAVSKRLRLSNWVKIVLCALLVVPIRWWVSRRPAAVHRQTRGVRRSLSPTVTILELGRQSKRPRGGGAMSTHSTHSARSYYKDDFMTSRDATPFDNQHPMSGGDLVDGVDAPLLTIDDAESTMLRNQMESRFYTSSAASHTPHHNLHPPHRPHSASSAPPLYTAQAGERRGERLRGRSDDFRNLTMFYDTPIVKFWLSLVARLAYLTLFAYTLLLPGCLSEALELVVWLWSLMWFLEALWVLSIRLPSSPANQMRWRIFDLCCVGGFLIGVLLFRLIAPQLWTAKMLRYSYVLRVAWTSFLVYQCYTTLFVYVPMSEVLCPLLVRVRLMITRDFFYYAILISLVFASSVVALKAVVYPDLGASYAAGRSILGWAWFSIFATEVGELRESDACRRMTLAERSVTDQCRAMSGYTNAACPSQGLATQVAIYQYLILLKLISWPILFALFARTAKKVDEEADQIFKYQLYSLAMDFNIRPFLPPPFTLLFFLGIGARRVSSCFSTLFGEPTMHATDHPDARTPSSALPSNAAIYRNPSAQRVFWGRAAIEQWKREKKAAAGSSEQSESADGRSLTTWADRRLTDKLQLLVITSAFEQHTRKQRPHVWKRAAGTPHGRLTLDGDEMTFRDWTHLAPDYVPPVYSQPLHAFAVAVQKNVEENIAEVGRWWRQLKLNWHIAGSRNATRLLASNGLPLNPFGRTGLAGRGTYAKFGSNIVFVYVIFARFDDTLMVLTTGDNELPKKHKYGTLRADEHLCEVLSKCRVPDADIQRIAIRSHMAVGQMENHIAHVCLTPLSSSSDTDNAWTEIDVWSIYLDKTEPRNVDSYVWTNAKSTNLLPDHNEFIQISANMFNLTI